MHFCLGHLVPIAFFRWKTYDSTSLKVSTMEKKPGSQVSPEDLRYQLPPVSEHHVDKAGMLSQTLTLGRQLVTNTCKLLQSSYTLAFLVKTPAGRYLCIRAPLSCPLQSADHETAEALLHLHREQQSLSQLEDLQKHFDHQYDLVTCDAGSANVKYQSLHSTSEPGMIHGMLLCQIHKQSAVSTRAIAILPGPISGVIAFSLALRQTSSIFDLRKVLKEILLKSVVHRKCAPPAPGHPSLKARDALLDLCWPPSSQDLASQQRRAVLQAGFHGNPESDLIEYCCDSDNPDLEFWAEVLTLAIYSRLPFRCSTVVGGCGLSCRFV
jgi:hypothetical protein